MQLCEGCSSTIYSRTSVLTQTDVMENLTFKTRHPEDRWRRSPKRVEILAKQCNLMCDDKWCVKLWFDADTQIDIGIGTTDSAVGSNSTLDR